MVDGEETTKTMTTLHVKRFKCARLSENAESYSSCVGAKNRHFDIQSKTNTHSNVRIEGMVARRNEPKSGKKHQAAFHITVWEGSIERVRPHRNETTNDAA